MPLALRAVGPVLALTASIFCAKSTILVIHTVSDGASYSK
jgi:hypothetical protein